MVHYGVRGYGAWCNKSVLNEVNRHPSVVCANVQMYVVWG